MQQFLLLDIKQLDKESNPPIDIHITKREREREKERENLRNFYLLQQFLLLDIKQLNEKSNPPIDIHITKREREREKERERICEIFTCCSNSFCLASSLLLSSRTVEQEKQYVESINIINHCTCNKAAIGQITHFHKCTLVLSFSFCFHFLQIQFLQDTQAYDQNSTRVVFVPNTALTLKQMPSALHTVLALPKLQNDYFRGKLRDLCMLMNRSPLSLNFRQVLSANKFMK